MRRRILAVVLLLGFAAAGQADDTTPPETRDGHRPRLALALSGGGARGIAHIGVLRALGQTWLHAFLAGVMLALCGGGRHCPSPVLGHLGGVLAFTRRSFGRDGLGLALAQVLDNFAVLFRVLGNLNERRLQRRNSSSIAVPIEGHIG